jgi:hypothetical protein
MGSCEFEMLSVRRDATRTFPTALAWVWIGLDQVLSDAANRSAAKSSILP